jgi:hypothetical protein
VTPVTALVIAHRGGADLATTLASLDWVARRYVADPTGAVGPADWPPGIERWPADEAPGWLLLLAEGERASTEFAAAVTRAQDGHGTAYRVAVECQAFRGAIRLRGAPVRLTRERDRTLHVSRGGELGFTAARGVPVLAGALVLRRVPSLPADAVDALNAEATVLAALAAAGGIRPRFSRLVSSGVTAAARVLFGRGHGRLGWGRWIAAVLAGYRGLLAEAKLWERTQLGVPPPS